jgi:hypothetical protein
LEIVPTLAKGVHFSSASSRFPSLRLPQTIIFDLYIRNDSVVKDNVAGGLSPRAADLYVLDLKFLNLRRNTSRAV